jgi:hypothetical protein
MPNLDDLRIEDDNPGQNLSPDPKGGSLSTGGSPTNASGAGGTTVSSAGSVTTAGSSVGGSAAGGAPSAGAGGSAPTAGAAPVCVPRGAEVCNGFDDDCNGVKDDGCPSAASTTFVKDLPALGDSPGGSVFTDDCKDGEVLAGIELGIDNFLARVSGICRKMQVQLRADAPGQYNVVLTDESSLAPHPESTPDKAQKLACMDNEALVGVRIGEQTFVTNGVTQTLIPKVWISCAKLTLSKQGNAFAINWEGKKELAPIAGSYANNMAYFAESNAEAGTVPTRLLGASGSWIDRVGFGVSTIQVIVAH